MLKYNVVTYSFSSGNPKRCIVNTFTTFKHAIIYAIDNNWKFMGKYRENVGNGVYKFNWDTNLNIIPIKQEELNKLDEYKLEHIRNSQVCYFLEGPSSYHVETDGVS